VHRDYLLILVSNMYITNLCPIICNRRTTNFLTVSDGDDDDDDDNERVDTGTDSDAPKEPCIR